MQPFEKLGAFYLGRGFDPQRRKILPDLLLYDAKDLTTHAVCVGMTGSGKTGLCVSLLEEAAIDGVPTIAIDPKGDLGNLLLTFPELRGQDFLPWIDESSAARKGQSPAEFAAATAQLWKDGLAEWGQDGDRIARFRDSVERSIYTPGSSAGRPLRVLRSFAAPPPALLDDLDALRERVTASASGLLALLGLDPDPVRSREHILLSNILQQEWSQGRDLDIASLIRTVQSPSMTRIGVMDLETFFPSRDRLGFSMQLNNLVASPSFASWSQGEPLEIPRLLWTPDGKPRISILSIAHLSDAERMFFVTVLLNELVTWMRTQPGTTSLRALLYMDEVFGYFPPTANPPSKMPMITLLKQARAYGLGVVLATQNPADLDYKGLSNAGTWFLGRLQAERDKMRVLEGLEGASAVAGASFNRARMEATLSGLKSRVFLMNNVHDDAPVLFHTRWALSYLRGPLTRAQIRRLTGERQDAARPAPQPAPVAPAAAQQAPGAAQERALVPADITEFFVPPEEHLAAGERLLYRPSLLGSYRLHFVSARQKVDQWAEGVLMALLEPDTGGDPWEAARQGIARSLLEQEPEADADFGELPAAATRAKTYAGWGKKLRLHLYRTELLTLRKCPELKAVSEPGESEGDFRVRLAQTYREKRDLKAAKLEKRYTPKLARLKERIRKSEEKVEREQSQYGHQKMQTAISVGATLLGALFGRKAASVGTVGRATTAMRGAGRAAREKGDIARALEDLEAHRERLTLLEQEFEDELDQLQESVDPALLELQEVPIRPRKADISVVDLALVWTPWRARVDGLVEPLFFEEPGDVATEPEGGRPAAVARKRPVARRPGRSGTRRRPARP